MDTKKLDLINIVLMLVAFVIAMWLPFELFIFSYVCLGPLHYLTEISWLEQRQFFTTKKNDYIILSILCLVAVLGVFAKTYSTTNWEEHIAGPLVSFIIDHTTHLIFIAFALAISFAFIKKNVVRIISLLVAVAAATYLQRFDAYILLFAVFLPTIIHVYFFTGSFMLYGALSKKSKIGFISFIVFIACGIASLFWELLPFQEHIGNYVREGIFNGKFHLVNYNIFKIIEPEATGPYKVFELPISFQIQRFIAFAYTYHYLNWFSKTKIIRWHDTSKTRLIGIAIIWIGTIVLFRFSFTWGYTLLLFLSLLHVFLEFPLNHKTFVALSNMIFSKKS